MRFQLQPHPPERAVDEAAVGDVLPAASNEAISLSPSPALSSCAAAAVLGANVISRFLRGLRSYRER
ncbi:hypothetical protein BZL29_5156 [Mycobacterium kansasii]|uniref:Uncharacterized protein n=1 Tax=Mycobacterium kansasii TaxID=1768 RepID=A0A1V3X2U2_MYCKA|nr:hypothetical protein BZL29_5156 [Mycobacterium kansasii]